MTAVAPSAGVRSAAIAAGIALALVLGADAAQAAFPGKNGRIAFTVERWRLPDPCLPIPHGCEPGAPDSTSIQTARPDGGGRRVLREFAPDRPPYEPAWSPDGRLLAFQQGDRLAIIHRDGRRLRHLPPQLAHGDAQPAWSPDGRRLVFAGKRCLSCPGWLYTVRSDGTGLRRLVRRAALAPAWSVTDRIAFVHDNDGLDGNVGLEDGLYAVAPDGSRLRRVFRGRSAPDWSPDGSRLVLADGRRVSTVGADGRGLRRLTKERTGFHPTNAVWSPDGRFIAFVLNGDDLYVMRANGRGLRKVVDAGEDPDDPRRPWDEIGTVSWQPLHTRSATAVQDPTWSVLRPVLARPPGGARYFGFVGTERTAGFGEVVSALRLSPGGRQLARGSYVDAAFTCGTGRSQRFVQRRLSLAPPAGQAVQVRRDGSFSRTDRRGNMRSRVRGRFVAPGLAKLAHRVRTAGGSRPSRCDSGRVRVTLFRNGVPPFSGCRTQRARTLAETSEGRVFEQNRVERVADPPPIPIQFFAYAYACSFDAERRVLLGRNWDDETVEVPRLAGALVAYAHVGCGLAGCGAAITVRDLRAGTLVKGRPAGIGPPDGPESVPDLVLHESGSVAWTVSRGSWSDRAFVSRELWASDRQGDRRLDQGPGLDLTSLALTGSTLSWSHDGIVRTATLD